MRNAIVVSTFVILLMLSGCKPEPPVYPPTPPDASIPSLSWSIASFASVTRFYPFGDTTLGNPASPGFQMLLSDTTVKIFTACSGIVQSITPCPNGGNMVLIKYKSNSIYAFQYSGLATVNVHVNDSVGPDVLLGSIVPSGLMGFAVIKNGSTAICPSSLAAQAFKNSIETAIARNNIISPEDSVNCSCFTDSVPF